MTFGDGRALASGERESKGEVSDMAIDLCRVLQEMLEGCWLGGSRTGVEVDGGRVQ